MGTALFRQGDCARGIFIIRRGWVKLFHSSPEGGTVTIGLGGPGAILGLPAVLDDTVHTVTAQTVEESDFEFIAKDPFLGFLDEHPEMAATLLSQISRERRQLLIELCEIAERVPAIDRLLHTLRNLAATCGSDREAGTRIGLPLTVQDLADRIGCSRQWTSKLLGELEQRQLIRRQGAFVLLRPQAFEPTSTTASTS
jgi:CRP-like cAMP-binding protein